MEYRYYSSKKNEKVCPQPLLVGRGVWNCASLLATDGFPLAFCRGRFIVKEISINSPCLLYAWLLLLPSTMIHFSIIFGNRQISWLAVVREFCVFDGVFFVLVIVMSEALF